MNAFICAISFTWIGMVIAISFMEAWLKFKAPGVTLALGLGIGKIVFSALNRVELFFASLLVIFIILNKQNLLENTIFVIASIALALLIQMVFIMPILSERANKLIALEKNEPSKTHIYYVGLELFKLTGLFILGIQTLN